MQRNPQNVENSNVKTIEEHGAIRRNKVILEMTNWSEESS